MNFTILHFDSIDSTNLEAIQQAQLGADEGVCVVAREQTSGRGRQGRIWVSEKDAGLYFSLVLRPKIETKFLPLITLMSATAVFETLREFGLNPDIKWVNDIHINGKKICGILAETSETKKGLAVIVGIGINLKATNFPPELNESATSVESETQKPVNANVLLQALTAHLSEYCAVLYGADGTTLILEEWAKRSSYFFGKKVRVVLENETIFGTTCGLENNGALRVKTETGEVRIIQAGDVEMVRKMVA